MTGNWESTRRLVGTALIGGCLIWFYWPIFSALASLWSHDPQYSHGYLVPLFSLCLLWRRRDELAERPAGYSWWGVFLLLIGASVRLAGAYYFVPWLEFVSLLPSAAGFATLILGARGFAWSWPAVAYLAFMLPLPYQLQVALAHPLQRVATTASTYLIQTLGVPALAEGNVILLRGGRIGVVEACNGLSMMVTFLALTAALAVVVRRPPAEKLALVLSAVPVAVAANVLRITVTAVLHETVGGTVAYAVYHDWAGWLMMPAALGLLGLELLLLKKLVTRTPDPASPDPPPGPRPPDARAKPRRAAPAARARIHA
jgi:exosortase